jgi:hypothetical protein
MDPDETLRRMLELANMVLEGDYTNRGKDNVERVSARICDAEELAELVQALDEWMKKGGFRPNNWEITKVESIPPAG